MSLCLAQTVTDDERWQTATGPVYVRWVLWINDGLMTLFFFLVALELKRRACLLVVGALVWAAIDASGIHATVTGVVLW